MSRRLGLTLALITCSAATFPRDVHAQTETADALVARGVELRRTGQDQQALELFRRAFEMSHSPRAEAQMGLAEQALGRWLEADQHVHEAYAASTDAWIQSHRQGLDASIIVIEQHVGRLEIIGNVPGAELIVNGQPAGTMPLTQPLRLIAGTVSVELRANGYQTAQRTLPVIAGRLGRESIDLLPRPATVTTEPPDHTTTAAPGTQPSPEASPTSAVNTSTTSTRREPAPATQSSGVSPVVVAIGAGATVIAAGVLIWSGLDTLAARDAYVLNPTEQGYNDGVGRQTRTNALIGTVSVLGVATIAIAAFATHWGGSTESTAAGATHAVRRRALPFIGASGDGVALGVNGTF